MRRLLLLLMILFALIALPAGAQNGTEMMSATEVVIDSQSESSSSDGAIDTDILTQSIFEEDSESSSLYLSSEEYASPEQSLAHEDISEKETINNLDSLSNSAGPESSADESYNDAEAESIGEINNSGQTYNSRLTVSKELIETVNVFDRSEVVVAEEDVSIVAFADQTYMNDQGEILKIFEQSDLNFNNNGANDRISGDSNFTENDYLKDELEQFRNGPVGSMETEDQAGTPSAYPVYASPERESGDARDPNLNVLSEFERIKGLVDGTNVNDQNVVEIFWKMNSQFDILQNSGSKSSDDSTFLPYWIPLKPSDKIHIETPYLADYSAKDENDEPKNYAVVVGINQYSDRRNLRTSVNDAEEMARILRELYGYEVIMLTDKTENRPPTKHNILEGALAEIKAKQNKGDVLVYFSGHGEVDDRGNFYLIPQDADADPASYISEDELNRYIKDIKGLSLIVDACYSGRLYNTESRQHYDGLRGIGKGVEQEQLILKSSRENEPSNEMWNETNSVFTYYLCQAIKDEAKKSDRLPLQLSLQSCFASVREKTVRWSSSHFLSQTPIISIMD